jgi:predicted Zn-dependent protease
MEHLRGTFFITLYATFLLNISVIQAQEPVTHTHEKRLLTFTEKQTLDSLYANILPIRTIGADREQLIAVCRSLQAPETDLARVRSLPGLPYLVFPLRVAMVVQPGRSEFVSAEKIRKSLKILNKGLEAAHVQFVLVRTDTIYENSTIPVLIQDGYEPYFRFSKMHDTGDTCSLYLVDNDEHLCENYACSRTLGFANILQTSTNNVVMDKFFVDDYKTLVHEFGHYFGLYHTAETYFGVEKVNGENCHTAGDRVCDTPADPGELYNVYVNYSNCEMKGFKEEGSGLEYRPIVQNYMSYYSPCYMREFSFTEGQMDVVFSAATRVRHNQIVALSAIPVSE